MKLSDGWLDAARKAPSPNFNSRPEGESIDLLVIHNISLPPGQFGNSCIEQFFQNCLPWDDHPFFEEIRGVEVSSHFLIRRDGEIVQFVSCDDRAWHAGKSEFNGRANCNDFSIGIELEGTDTAPYEEAQYESLKELTRAIQTAYTNISQERITGHCHIAPERKTDPGQSFDWARYKLSLSKEAK